MTALRKVGGGAAAVIAAGPQRCCWLPSDHAVSTRNKHRAWRCWRLLPTQGGYLRKYGRFGKPKQHWFRLSHDDKELLWDSSNVSSTAGSAFESTPELQAAPHTSAGWQQCRCCYKPHSQPAVSTPVSLPQSACGAVARWDVVPSKLSTTHAQQRQQGPAC